MLAWSEFLMMCTDLTARQTPQAGEEGGSAAARLGQRGFVALPRFSAAFGGSKEVQ